MLATLIKNIYIYFKKPNVQFLNITNILLIVSILILIVLLIILLKSRMNVNQCIDNEGAISFKFRAKSMEVELYFDDRKNIQSKLIYNMDVLVNGVTEIERPITWTGTTYNGTTISDSNGNYSIIDSNRKASPYNVKVLFNEAKNSGDCVRFSTNTSVVDDNLEMNPYYSFMVKYQIDKLILHVVAPENLIKNVKKAVYADVGREINVIPPETIPHENIGKYVRYTYIVENPTFLYNYFIEWEFTN